MKNRNDETMTRAIFTQSVWRALVALKVVSWRTLMKWTLPWKSASLGAQVWLRSREQSKTTQDSSCSRWWTRWRSWQLVPLQPEQTAACWNEEAAFEGSASKKSHCLQQPLTWNSFELPGLLYRRQRRLESKEKAVTISLEKLFSLRELFKETSSCKSSLTVVPKRPETVEKQADHYAAALETAVFGAIGRGDLHKDCITQRMSDRVKSLQQLSRVTKHVIQCWV